ncbi:MAG: FG-GAP-like repeat-containing protein [Methylococcaceae bacterium]
MKIIKTSFVLSSLLVGAALTHALPAQAGFTNATASSGLASSGGSRGAGWADYNKDGCIDVMVSYTDASKLYQGNCNGAFTDVSASAGISAPAGGFAVSWADYDADGDMDVYVASTANNVLYKNNGNGTFTDVAAAAGVDDPRGSTGASWGDYNGDGYLDLFIANQFEGAGTTDRTDRLYKNNGNGTFTDVAATAGVGGSSSRLSFMGIWFDYDNNNTLDLYVTVDFGNDILYSNNGNGTFTDVTVAAGINGPQHGMGVAVGDLNMAASTWVSTNNTIGSNAINRQSFLYINNCNGTFTEAAEAKGIKDLGVVDWGANFVDFDNDADLDFSIVAGGMLSAGQPNVLYENPNICNGQFFDVTNSMGVADSGAALSSTWIDVNNDGKLDWFVTNLIGSNALFINNGPTGNYLKVKLNGSNGNTQGIGAVVKVMSGGVTQSRLITSGESFAASQEQAAYFGLGLKNTVDKVTVTWPNGNMTEVSNTPANQAITIDEQVACETGVVSGIVYNPSGAPEPGVRVSAKDSISLATLATTINDSNGFYSLSIAPGDYKIIGAKAGFRINTAPTTTVESCDNKTIDINLNLPR